MRHAGTLRTWNDERGYGFIAPTDGGRELFVHVSALPRDGTRPTVGERLTFERGEGRDGKPQAVRVQRQALAGEALAPAPFAAAPAARRDRTGGFDMRPVRRRGPRRSGRRSWLGVVVVVALAFAVFAHLEKRKRATIERFSNGAEASPAGYRCDGRQYCSQMTSCAEATWFLTHCPGTQMDGNGDGVPCEKQ